MGNQLLIKVGSILAATMHKMRWISRLFINYWANKILPATMMTLHSILQDCALHLEVALSLSLPLLCPLSRWHTSVRSGIRRRPSVRLYMDLVRLAFVLVCDPHMDAAAATANPKAVAAARRWCYQCERRV